MIQSSIALSLNETPSLAVDQEMPEREEAENISSPPLSESPAAGLGAVGRAVKVALNRAAGASKISREEILHRADILAKECKVNLCPGGGLGISTLNKWLDTNDPGHMPSLVGLIALCLIMNVAEPLGAALKAVGLEVMGPEDRKYRDMGRAYDELKKARQGLKKAESKLERGRK